MNGAIDFAGDLVGRFNPADPVNLTLFFGWLVIFVFTFTGVWRARWRWVRLCCYLVNQAASFIMLQAGILTLAIAFNRWREAAATALITFVISLWLFRERPTQTNQRARQGKPA
ncbi:MAG: hypothetical protein ACTSX7_07435 [Alphaproteobacteria bacterium]